MRRRSSCEKTDGKNSNSGGIENTENGVECEWDRALVACSLDCANVLREIARTKLAYAADRRFRTVLALTHTHRFRTVLVPVE